MSAHPLVVAGLLPLMLSLALHAQPQRARDHGIVVGTLPTGPHNALTDVAGVAVGHVTLIEGESVRTGVTAILPHGGNLFQEKVPAAIYIANGFGKLAGYSQVAELGNIETPIVLTNPLSVPTAADALLDHALADPANAGVRSVNPVVGETNDGRLNDIRGRHVTREHVLTAIAAATTGPVAEGNVGAGTGTICFGWKGGIGTASRVLPGTDGGWTVGVLVQTNYGGDLTIAGVPVGRELKRHAGADGDGSCMVIVATDAPLSSRNLKRLARRATFGIARTGGHYSNGSGEYVIAFSSAADLRVPYGGDTRLLEKRELRNEAMSPLFAAVIEATEEAIVNSLVAAETVSGHGGTTVEALPMDAVVAILKRHGAGRE